jgi:hypothetical protein
MSAQVITMTWARRRREVRAAERGIADVRETLARARPPTSAADLTEREHGAPASDDWRSGT